LLTLALLFMCITQWRRPVRRRFPFDLTEGKTRKLAIALKGLRAPKETAIKSIPDDLFKAAKRWLEEEALQRYICNKYSMPPTDPRLLAYTVELMMLEFVADAIEDNKLIAGADGMPARKVLYKGEEIYETGDPEWDAMEREWVDDWQAPVPEDYVPYDERETFVEDEDLLPAIQAHVETKEDNDDVG
ncbi:MAG: hypothetical protein KKB59_20000, partial [Spirochaetes bacterium]|nr:hypothetical protein [Spirochaetota bacterium]